MGISIKKCKDIAKGEFLIYDHNAYLKIPTINYYTTANGLSLKGNVVGLTTGAIGFIHGNANCELIKGPIQILR